MPVLAGSVAYAVGEARGWQIGLEQPLNEARPFYIVIALAILAGRRPGLHAARSHQGAAVERRR